MYNHFRSVPKNIQFHTVFSFFILIALVATLYAPGTPGLALTFTSLKNQGVNAYLPSHDGVLDEHVEQTGIVRSISPSDGVEEATLLQQAIMQSIEQRKASKLPVPSSASYEYEVMPRLSAANFDEASDSPIQEFKLVYRTELQFDSPQQAGWEKWPDVVIKDTMPPNAKGFVNAGDNTQSVRDAAEQAQPGIWEQYEFGQEPRTFVYEETFEVFRTDENSAAPEVMSANPVSSGDILFGFTNSFVYDYKFVMSQEIVPGAKIWAEAQVSYGWGAGIRLPINVSVTLDTEGKGEIIQGSNYWLKSSINYSPSNWTADDYLNAGLPEKDIWNGKELVLDALYRVHVAAGSGETTYINKTYEGNYSLSKVGVDENGNPKLCEKLQDFVTPFGDFYYPPGEEDPDCPFPGNKTGGINIFDFDPLFYIPLGDLPFIANVSLGFGFIVNAGLGSKSITARWAAEGTASGEGDINYPAYNKEIIFGPVTADAANQPVSIRLNKWIYHPSLLLRILAYPCLKAVVLGNEQTKCMRNLQLKIYEKEILEGADLSVHKGTPDSIVLEKIPVSSSVLIEMISDKSVVPVGDTATITTTIKNIGSTKLTNVRISEDTVGVAVLPELNPGDKFSLEPHTFTATEDKDITSTIVVTATLTGDSKPVPITSTAYRSVPVPNGVIGGGTTESCNDKALDVELSNSESGDITFNCGGPATVTIDSTKVIARDITMNGSASDGDRITISGDNRMRVFEVREGVTLTLQNLAVANGKKHRILSTNSDEIHPALEAGAGIYNLGIVNLQNVLITGNEADQGGGIHNGGTLNITNSLLSNNSAKLTDSGNETWDGGAISNYGSLTITNSTIENNTANGGGGLINWNGNEVIIINSVITGNHAGNGGGIENGANGMVTISNNTVIRDNEATIGGGIFNFDTGRMEIFESEITDNRANQAGGIQNNGILGIQVDIDHHTILPGTTIVSGNWAAIGGGIFNHETGRMVISSSQITDNIASQAGGIQNKGVMGIQIDINNNDSILLGTTLLEGNQAVSTEENPTALDGGAIYNDGALKIANSTIEHNTARGGGGILNWFDDNTSLGTVEITGSTIANNWAGNGGGIENGCSDGQIGCGILILRNSTLFNNRAIDIGGGIVNFGAGRTIVADSTLAFNTASTGGGIHNAGSFPVEIGQSIIANNHSDNCQGMMTSTGYNIDNGNTCGFSNANNIINTDPLLGSATENGGLTLTLALSPKSPAIDYIPAEACTVATDQRGEEYPRPVDGNKDGIAKCDIGAFELNPPTSDHITVTSSANSGPGSLRWALAEITDGGIIDFAFPQSTEIKLTSELVVDRAVSVNGPGVHELKISGNKMTRLFKVMGWASLNIHSLTLSDGKVHLPFNVSGLVEPGGGIFNLGTVNIQNAVITNNEADQGGAIHNSGILTISGSLITNNAAGTSSEFGDGGGIYNDGKLTIRNTSLLDNRAHGGGGIINWGKGKVEFITSAIAGNSAGNGGGIENGDEGVVIIENNSTIENNSATFIGGGIVNYDAGVIEIRDTLLSKNSVLQDGGSIYVGGGGIYNFGNGTVDIANSTLSDNLANSGYGAGIRNQGTMSVLYTKFNGNKVISKERGDGGGVYNEGNITITGSSFFSNEAVGGGGLINYGQSESKFGWADIRQSTFAYNISYNGGAVENAGFGEVVISNSTFSQNQAKGGGGIANFNQAYTKITNSTIAFNNASDGGGIYNVGNIPVEIDQSILAKNQLHNCTGPMLSSGNNLDSDDTCAFPIEDNLINIDPLLGPLQNNGGPTLTHALLPGSPAIDRVDSMHCPPPETDQRGIGRPQRFSCDIGAFEILNNPPIAGANGPYTVDEGSMVTLNASASTDPDGDPLTYEWDLDNDGVYDVFGMTVETIFPDDGQYLVALLVSDPMGAQSTDTAVVDVLNVPPAIGEISLSKMPALVKASVSVSASFSDPGPLDTYTASWDWGDGNNSTGRVDDYSVTGSHAYSMPGIYILTLTLTDDDGGFDSLTYQYIIVYSPDAGFITGGKWINSPAGSYIPDPTLTGKAAFNFNLKYQKGAVSPTGKADFQFKAADLDFKSTSYDWLVIAGTKAQFKGTGSINGAGDYSFMMTVIDGSPDLFRIRIWDTDTGSIVYDNMPGAEDHADPTTAVQGGSIVFHKGK